MRDDLLYVLAIVLCALALPCMAVSALTEWKVFSLIASLFTASGMIVLAIAVRRDHAH